MTVTYGAVETGKSCGFWRGRGHHLRAFLRSIRVDRPTAQPPQVTAPCRSERGDGFSRPALYRAAESLPIQPIEGFFLAPPPMISRDAPLGDRQSESPTLNTVAVRPCFAFGPPLTCQNPGPGRSPTGRDLRFHRSNLAARDRRADRSASSDDFAGSPSALTSR
jgi:hypothetical protein